MGLSLQTRQRAPLAIEYPPEEVPGVGTTYKDRSPPSSLPVEVKPIVKFKFGYVEVGGIFVLTPTKVACLNENDPDTVYVQEIPLPMSIFQTVPSKCRFENYLNVKYQCRK